MSSTERLSATDFVARTELKDEYMTRLSLEAVEALATAAAMRWQHRESSVQHLHSFDVPVHDDPLSREAAEVLTEVMALHRENIEEDHTPAEPQTNLQQLDSPLSSSHSFEDTSSSAIRGKYRCGRCGQMKVNHVCPLMRAPLQRSVYVQTVPITILDSSSTEEATDLQHSSRSLTLQHIQSANDHLITIRRRKRSLSDIQRGSDDDHQKNMNHQNH
mmetsp:Transcript_13262/g.17706  ORF Transcript_13262/g.17706 Transcript_13262/m.17706 type:complete len:217 (+) Transcript_13262:46-696(+)